jgi:hypothetical protein
MNLFHFSRKQPVREEGPAAQVLPLRHPIRVCDRLLRDSPLFDPSHCRPEQFVCICGRTWIHVCDEAEGCSYMEGERLL